MIDLELEGFINPVESIEDWPPENGAEFRIAHCYRCNKLDMIDKRGLCLSCTYELLPKIQKEPL